MNAAPGWYDAGTPGRVRWWDGAQWTAHERESAAAPGWYAAKAHVVRWWDGRLWTGLRLKDGKPGTDWASSEQPALAWTLGGVFLAMGVAQLALGTLTTSVSFSGVTTLLLAGLWFAMAAQTQAVRSIPAPTGQPVVIDEVRPLLGEQEGPGAGWYPVAPRTSRWWTGTRWSAYAHTAYGIRPMFHGPRAYRTLLAVYGAMTALGLIAAAVGIALVVVGGQNGSEPLLSITGVIILAAGILFALMGGILLLVSRSQRRILLPPAGAPNLPSGVAA